MLPSIFISNALLQCFLAADQNQIASLNIRIEMFVHGLFALNALVSDDCLLEVVGVEVCEIL